MKTLSLESRCVMKLYFAVFQNDNYVFQGREIHSHGTRLANFGTNQHRSETYSTLLCSSKSNYIILICQ